jgi:hypothetical protein
MLVAFAYSNLFTVALPREVRNAAGVVRVSHTQLPGEFVVGGVALIFF